IGASYIEHELRCVFNIVQIYNHQDKEMLALGALNDFLNKYEIYKTNKGTKKEDLSKNSETLIEELMYIKTKIERQNDWEEKIKEITEEVSGNKMELMEKIKQQYFPGKNFPTQEELTKKIKEDIQRLKNNNK
ncbi:MAG: hypothetical protein ABIF17_01560, partial [Patescibacteria group bacterium]